MDTTSISALPTDSLYKFIALSGLLVLLGSTLIIEYFRKAAIAHLFNLKKRVKSHDVKLKWFNNELDELKIKLSKLSEELEQYKTSLQDMNKNPENETINELKSLVEKYTKSVSAHKKRAEETEILSAELSVETEELEHLMGQMVRLRRMRIAAIAFGLLLSSAGFYLWYTKIQVYTDASLKAETNCSNNFFKADAVPAQPKPQR